MHDLYLHFDQVFFEKTRLSMMTLLFKEKCVSYNRFKKIIGGTDGSIYTHLKKLLEASYIQKKKELVGESAHTIYSLTRKGEKTFQEYMQFLETVIQNYKKGG
ncbi:MAG: transcriptional regulator [Spirochaetales bacterium]|nr:transcriptional regulator [Spirochaetales bacterium]